jgi:Fur family ferric uptake transcriptional regulator
VTGRRETPQRRAIAALLDQLDGFISARELHVLLHERGEPMGLATVYRTLHAMSEDGECDVLDSGRDSVAYRRCTPGGHHHHLICRSCGRTIEIAATDVEVWAQQAAARAGFTELAHSVEVFGVCRPCRDAEAGPEPSPAVPVQRSTGRRRPATPAATTERTS